MPLRRPEPLFIVVAILIIGGAAWLFIDRPRDAGARLSGTVEYCKTLVVGYETVPSWCQISISGQNRRVRVYMVSEPPGRKVGLIEMRRILTGRRYYAVDYAPDYSGKL